MLTSQSFASILAVSEESGGQEDSKFDNPKSGAGSSVSWKVAMDESKKNFVTMYNHKECRYCRRVIFSWWQGWSIFTYCSDLFHGGQTMVLAGCYGGWRPKSCEIWYHLNWLKICGWRFGRAIVVRDIEKISVWSQHFPVPDFFWSEQKVKVATCRSGGPSAPRLLCHQRHLEVSSSSEIFQVFKNIQRLLWWKIIAKDLFVLFWLGSKNRIGFCVNYRSFPPGTEPK